MARLDHRVATGTPLSAAARDFGWLVGGQLALKTVAFVFGVAVVRAGCRRARSLFRRACVHRAALDRHWAGRRAGFALHFDPAPVVEHRHARRTTRAVWRDCAGSGFHARRVRLRHPDLLAAPRLLHAPAALRALAPLLATHVTLSAAARWPATFRGRWSALPGFWLTKLAWAWGAGGRG